LASAASQIMRAASGSFGSAPVAPRPSASENFWRRCASVRFIVIAPWPDIQAGRNQIQLVLLRAVLTGRARGAVDRHHQFNGTAGRDIDLADVAQTAEPFLCSYDVREFGFL